jgi:hypothetical protein
MHELKPLFGSIVEPMEMQHPMHRIEQYFMLYFPAPLPRLPAGFWNANRYLPGGYTSASVDIQGEGQHIGWAGQSQKLMVKFRHLPVADQSDRQLP